MLKIKWVLVLILILSFTLVGNCADLYGTYDQRIKLTIDNTKIDSDLTWFPVMIKLTNAQMEEVFAEFDSDDDFDRCAITLADESTQIYGDCERFDDSGEVAEYHAAKTGVVTDADAAGYLYFYYDKDAAHNTTYISASGETAAQSVYDANFKAVYHMADGTSLPNFAWDTQYEANAEPDSDGWTLGGTDYSSVAGGKLTIDTSGNDTYTCYYYKQPDVNFDNGFYLKMKIDISGLMAPDDYLTLRVYDGTQNEYMQFLFYDGKVTIYHSTGTTDRTITTTDDLVYEIYVKGTAAKFYVDGSLSYSFTIPAGAVSDEVMFGDISSSVMCIVIIDYLYYALNVTNNPVEIIDSTSNANHGTKKGLGEPVEAAGKVGQAQDFDGSDDNITHASLLDTMPAAITVESIIYVDDKTAANQRIWEKVNVDGQERMFFYAADDNDVHFDYEEGNNGYIGTQFNTDWTQDTYEYRAVSWDTVNGILFYKDGAADGSSAGATTLPGNGTFEDFYVGGSMYASNNFLGIIDEFRVSGSQRNAAWEKATKETLFDALFTYGSEETSGVVTTNILFTFENL